MNQGPAAKTQGDTAGALNPVCDTAILGLGVDLCAIERMDRALDGRQDSFLAALFTPAEIACCLVKNNPAAMFAACFAAKEAVLKSLALVDGQGMFWQDIEIQAMEGQPRVLLRGRLAELAVGRVLVAVSWCRLYATATAVALA